MLKKSKNAQQKAIIPSGLRFVINLQFSLNHFQTGDAMFDKGVIVPYQLTTHTIFAISNKYNDMIFLIILIDCIFKFHAPEDEVDSDKVIGSAKNPGKSVFFTIVKKDNNS